MQKCKKSKLKSQPRVHFPSVTTTFARIPCSSNRFLNHLPVLLVQKFVAHIIFFVLTPILNNGFEMTGAQRTTRSRVPLLLQNAKICTISSEGKLMLQATRRIFGLHTAQSKRSCRITRNIGKLYLLSQGSVQDEGNFQTIIPIAWTQDALSRRARRNRTISIAADRSSCTCRRRGRRNFFYAGR